MGELAQIAALLESSPRAHDVTRLRQLVDNGVNPLFALLALEDGEEDAMRGSWNAA